MTIGGDNTTSITLTTNGTLTLNCLTGSNGQLLTYNNGNVVWASSTVQSGKVLNPTYSSITPGVVTFDTPFIGATSPSVTLTVDTGSGSTSIVLAGLAGFTSTGSGVDTNWTGFNWFISSAVPPGGYLNWIASPAFTVSGEAVIFVPP